MISFDENALYALLASFFWPFTRILAMISVVPVLGHRSVPVRAKIALAAMVALIISPALPAAGLSVPLNSPLAAATLLQQILLGTAMGLVLRVVFGAVELAGEVIGMQMGLNFAGFFDPETQTQGTPIGAWLGLLATLAFLSLNGHLLVLYAIAQSFQSFPIDGTLLPTLEWQRIAMIGGEMFRIGIYASLPVVGAMLVCNLGIGVLARIAPQMNVLAISFAITIPVGLLVLLGSLPYVSRFLEGAMLHGVELMAW